MLGEAQQRHNNRHNKVKKGSFSIHNTGTITGTIKSKKVLLLDTIEAQQNSNFDDKAGTIIGTLNSNQGSFTRNNIGTKNFEF